jgi:phosphopantetheine adenylyltransferase
MFDADRFYMTPPIGNIGICSEGSSHFASIVVQIMMTTRQQLCIAVKTRTNLIKLRRITTSRENSVSTPPIAEVIPLY